MHKKLLAYRLKWYNINVRWKIFIRVHSESFLKAWAWAVTGNRYETSEMMWVGVCCDLRGKSTWGFHKETLERFVAKSFQETGRERKIESLVHNGRSKRHYFCVLACKNSLHSCRSLSKFVSNFLILIGMESYSLLGRNFSLLKFYSPRVIYSKNTRDSIFSKVKIRI